MNSTLVERFRRDGYVVTQGLFSPEEASRYLQHYMDLRAAGTYEGDSTGVVDYAAGAGALCSSPHGCGWSVFEMDGTPMVEMQGQWQWTGQPSRSIGR